jgi:hypothetical protein
MVPTLLICAGLLAAGPPDAPSDLASYQMAKAHAGHNPRAQVRLALWCKAHGMEAERLEHLARAVLADPQNATARGLLGLVAYGGQWLSPESVSERLKSDEALTAKLAEYDAKRHQTPDTADGHWELALWCENKGLKAEAMAHLIAVTQFDPKRDEAWERLGCRLYQGRWLNSEQIAAEEAEAAVQEEADARWEPYLAKWWGEWNCGDSRREAADRALAGMIDPRAVHAIRHVLCTDKPVDQEMAVQLLGQIDSPLSSQTLVDLVLDRRSASVVDAAVLRLKGRNRRDFMDGLIGSLQPLIPYRVEPGAQYGQLGRLVMEGGGIRRTLTYQGPPASLFPGRRVGSIGYDGFGRPLLQAIPQRVSPFQRAAQTARLNAELALDRDVRQLQVINREVSLLNEPITEALGQITEQPIGNDPEGWRAWWFDQVGYQYAPPTTSEYLSRKYARRLPIVTIHHGKSCFAAGTPVETWSGLRAIESLQVGDMVLSQDEATGALDYEPIVAVHANPPAITLRIGLRGETVDATIYHRFWRPGKGWAMARDLKVGDRVGTPGGELTVSAIEKGEVQRVFNLDVMKMHSFFVGRSYVLVHDNTLPPPRFTPFDAEPLLTSINGGDPVSENEKPDVRDAKKAAELPAAEGSETRTGPVRHSILGPR